MYPHIHTHQPRFSLLPIASHPRGSEFRLSGCFPKGSLGVPCLAPSFCLLLGRVSPRNSVLQNVRGLGTNIAALSDDMGAVIWGTLESLMSGRFRT